MDAFQITPFDGEVARHFGTDGDTDGIERRGDLFGGYFVADHRVDFEDDPFLFHQPDHPLSCNKPGCLISDRLYSLRFFSCRPDSSHEQ